MKSLSAFFVVIALLFVSSKANSFDVVFRQGKVEMVVNGGGSSLSIGMSIRQGCMLRLSKGSSVVLRKRERYILLEALRQDIQIKYEDIVKVYENGSQGDFISMTLDHLADQLGKEKVDIRKYAEEHLRQKGGVVRGAECSPSLMISPLTCALVPNGEVVFSWLSEEGSDSYEFFLYGPSLNGSERPLLLNRMVSDTVLTISTSEFQRNDVTNQSYSWLARPTGIRGECAGQPFFLITPEERQAIIDEVNRQSNSLRQRRDRLLFRALFLEQKGLLEDAYTAYMYLAETFPTSYNKGMLTFFMARNGLLNIQK
jgi:hypothetical protein